MMNDVHLTCEIANLTQEPKDGSVARDAIVGQETSKCSDRGISSHSDSPSATSLAAGNSKHHYHRLNSSQKQIIVEHLEEWEEPKSTKLNTVRC